jgi:hypothetical protein
MLGHAAVHDHRGEPRDEVMHRTGAIDASGRSLKLVLVNISASGLMARCDGDVAAGGSLRIQLPILGDVGATVRWSLGGRIGCEFASPIALADYYGMLSVMIRNF